MIKKIFIYLSILILTSTTSLKSNEVKIITKVGKQIITNIDIENEYKYLVSVNNTLIPYILYAEINGLDIYFTKLNKQHKFVKKFSKTKNKISDKTILKKYKIHLLNDSRFIW